MIRSLVVFSALFVVAFATYGVDVSTAVMPSTWQCMKNNGYTFGIIRCYQSNGRTDVNCPHTIYNAWAGGMEHVDAYMFPCPTCGNPAGQVQAMINYLKSYNCKFGMVWLDIEGISRSSPTLGPQYWMKSQASNIAFMQALMNECSRLGINYGVYSSASQWAPIMGTWSGASSRPLWYAHYDNNPSFSDFRPFGGWSRPAIKQYAGDVVLCGAGVDKNFY